MLSSVVAPTSIANSPVDTSQAAERGGNLQAEILDEEIKLEEDVELPAGLPGETVSQELFSTPEVLNREQEADEMLAELDQNTDCYISAQASQCLSHRSQDINLSVYP
ncbi:hypothetical protein UY3_12311 [Chelonia mydas]|uniref:Uncharacterized protein n=1 Tax=Chelonia mydas TaxID=8469 RepID=M7BR06_CHEMY|nr:hypothetical protein UY3_12311 [Chelonia mydas]